MWWRRTSSGSEWRRTRRSGARATEAPPHVEWEIEEVTPDILLVHSWMSARGRGSGVKAEAEIGQVWEFENGRATRQSMYRTYEEARQAADLLA